MRNLFVFFCFFFIETICFGDNHIPVEVTPEHFGCISNDKRQADNNSIALQNAINYCIKNGSKLVSIASNAYYISKGLTIPGYINIDLGGATLIATAPMSMVTIHYDKTEYWTGTIRNFRLNMNGIAKVGIDCDKVIKLHIYDGEFYNIGEHAVGLQVTEGYELFANNLHFHGSQKYSIGIKTLTSDCHFSDCIMINCYTAIDNTGGNFYERIHAWMLPQYLQGSIYFRNRSGLIFMSQCCCDTYDKAFAVDNICEMHISQLKLFHNKLMWKGHSGKIFPIVFFFEKETVANESKIFLSDSYIGSLILGNQDKQAFSNMQNKIKTFNCSFK